MPSRRRLNRGRWRQVPTMRLASMNDPKAKWIKKAWQKLGFYLHADWPFAVHKPKSSPRPFLEKTLTELAPLVENSFSAMLSMNITFTCAGCGTPVKVMEKAVERSREAVCLTCGMPYRAEKSDGGFTFFPGPPPFTCECGTATYVPSKQIKEDTNSPAGAAIGTFK